MLSGAERIGEVGGFQPSQTATLYSEEVDALQDSGSRDALLSLSSFAFSRLGLLPRVLLPMIPFGFHTPASAPKPVLTPLSPLGGEIAMVLGAYALPLWVAESYPEKVRAAEQDFEKNRTAWALHHPMEYAYLTVAMNFADQQGVSAPPNIFEEPQILMPDPKKPFTTVNPDGSLKTVFQLYWESVQEFLMALLFAAGEISDNVARMSQGKDNGPVPVDPTRDGEAAREGEDVNDPTVLWSRAPSLAETSRYGQMPHNLWLEPTLFITENLRVGFPEGEVLEIGAGSLRLAELIANECDVHVVATDVRPPPAEFATQRGSITYQQTRAENLPFSPDRFHAAVASLVLDYTGPEVISELYRVLRPDGRLVALSHYQDSGLTHWVVFIAEIYDLILRMEEATTSAEQTSLYEQMIDLLNRQPSIYFHYVAKQIRDERTTIMAGADRAIQGRLTPEERTHMKLAIMAGRQLGPSLHRSEEDIRKSFEQSGFRVEEMKPLLYTNSYQQVEYLLLGVIAVKPR